MMRYLFIAFSLALMFGCATQAPVTVNPEVKVTDSLPPENPEYRSSYTTSADLVHTRLSVSFDWKNKRMNGEAAIILRPHFYPIDSLTLNARGMDLKEVSILSSYGKHVPLKYQYDSLEIHMRLDRTYNKDESLTIFIKYIAKPEELPSGGSSAIRSDKGLYFIDADSLDPLNPTEVWTQGETESNSAWFPTIEDPAQKMTQEIYITVDTAFTTLSNGLLISSEDNHDGTKTDYWKQSLPAAPYLTMIAAGNFAVVKDKWKNIEVNYYVDPPYEKYARNIFGNTPEMIDYFSRILDFPYPWEKFSQVVVHNYVSGAMENTTAVVHGTNMQQNFREHADGNFEDYISHELFHHWFGDLVTCESWSNITLNEGFANYAQYLWREYKFGREDADKLNMNDMAIYLSTTEDEDPPVARYHYDNREDVYDGISYHKSGRILHMLRNLVGDSAFFASLHLYLESHSYSSAEIAELRIAFEKITGQDLNWFFDQWYLKGGHPVITINYNWNDSLHVETITIAQKQNLKKNPLYRLPMAVDIYRNKNIERKKIIVTDTLQQFRFELPSKPDLVNVDADKTLLCVKTDNKTNDEFIFQYNHAPLLADRFESVSKIGARYVVNTPEASLIKKALNDKFYSIRLAAINNIGELAKNDSGPVKEILKSMALKDSSVDVREKALAACGKYFSYSEISATVTQAIKDSSYKVEARALRIMSDKDQQHATEFAQQFEKDSNTTILSALSEIYSNSKTDKIGFYESALRRTSSFRRYQITKDFGKYLKSATSIDILSKGSNILSERAKGSASKNYKALVIVTLKDMESSVKSKIATLEAGENSSGSPDSIDKTADLIQWKNLRNTLHDKILSIDK